MHVLLFLSMNFSIGYQQFIVVNLYTLCMVLLRCSAKIVYYMALAVQIFESYFVQADVLAAALSNYIMMVIEEIY